ncbi:MAG: hypothetical protein ACE5IY_06445 [bacterium]
MTEPMISNIKKTRFYQEIRQEGLQEGIESGLRQTIYDILDIKFGAAGLRVFEQLTKTMSKEALENIRVGLKKAHSIEEAEEIIQTSAEK